MDENDQQRADLQYRKDSLTSQMMSVEQALLQAEEDGNEELAAALRGQRDGLMSEITFLR